MGGHLLKVYVTQANVSSHEVNVQSCLEIAALEHELFALQPNHVYLRKSQLKKIKYTIVTTTFVWCVCG